jgi:hypothetical protein
MKVAKIPRTNNPITQPNTHQTPQKLASQLLLNNQRFNQALRENKNQLKMGKPSLKEVDQRMLHRQILIEQQKLIKQKFMQIDNNAYKSRSSEEMFFANQENKSRRSKYRMSQDEKFFKDLKFHMTKNNGKNKSRLKSKKKKSQRQTS